MMVKDDETVIISLIRKMLCECCVCNTHQSVAFCRYPGFDVGDQ